MVNKYFGFAGFQQKLKTCIEIERKINLIVKPCLLNINKNK